MSVTVIAADERARTFAAMPINDKHNDPDRLLSMEELSEQLDTSMHTLYKWSRRGQPYFPRRVRLPNNEIRVRSRDLDAWLNGRAS